MTCAVLGSAATGITLLWSSVGNIATNGEVREAVSKHDQNKDAHETLQSGIRALSGQDMKAAEEVRAAKKTAEDLGARLVRLIAADAEPNPYYRALAAQFYERLYRRLIQRGVGVDDAISEAIDTPWTGRPKR
jgi:hypothetical protein